MDVVGEGPRHHVLHTHITTLYTKAEKGADGGTDVSFR